MDKCAVCQVKIEEDTVHFSQGQPGTRDRLWARVCQYTEKPGCINKISDYPGLKPKHIDYYRELPPLKFN